MVKLLMRLVVPIIIILVGHVLSPLLQKDLVDPDLIPH